MASIDPVPLRRAQNSDAATPQWMQCWAQWQIGALRDAEQVIWANNVAPLLRSAKANVTSLMQTGFTEMMNNAVEHADARNICASVRLAANALQIAVMDDGVGVFNRIADFLSLPDRRLAVLELAKGKLTTAARGHSGMGIFVTSRLFDRFTLRSNGLVFTRDHDFTFDWLDDSTYRKGTVVLMEIAPDSDRTTRHVYDQYFHPDQVGDDAFHATHVPVRLAALGGDLVSRSQGKWVVARVEMFSSVELDFTGVNAVGQGFVDEVFRVFATAHPHVHLLASHMTPDVAHVVKMFAPRPGPATM